MFDVKSRRQWHNEPRRRIFVIPFYEDLGIVIIFDSLVGKFKVNESRKLDVEHTKNRFFFVFPSPLDLWRGIDGKKAFRLHGKKSFAFLTFKLSVINRYN